ncbi:hypothetical protein CRM22_006734 [Opisthorchis felineus]|uniref:Uncharacterized protein n=1 Tax=Opisthorchis felineus TaxID=147828 RepID=A0A4S2LRV9_OPIFE|nr:hypothetical protein CRM22_006734 [Opisthorchis felineus]
MTLTFALPLYFTCPPRDSTSSWLFSAIFGSKPTVIQSDRLNSIDPRAIRLCYCTVFIVIAESNYGASFVASFLNGKNLVFALKSLVNHLVDVLPNRPVCLNSAPPLRRLRSTTCVH